MGAGTVRSVHYAVEFDGNTSALEEWNKKLLESKKDGDLAAGSINKMEREMVEYAQKIGLSRSQLERLAKTQIKDQKIGDFAKQYGFASGEVKKMSEESEGLAGKLGKAGSALKALAATAALTAAIGFMGGMVKQAATFEQTKMSFEVMLHSADAAKKTLEDLNQFSIKTPFTPDQVIASGRALIAYGVKPGQELNNVLQMVGDVAAGVGMDFNELSNIMGKNLTQGVVQTEDLMQLAGRGVPIFDSMAKVFNTTTDQVKKLASTGQIKFEHLKQAFASMTSSGGMYFGMMDKLGSTALGKWSTVMGNVDEIKKRLGEMLLVALKPLLDILGKFLDWMMNSPVAMGIIKGIFIALIPVVGVLAVAAVMALVSAFGSLAVAMITALWPVYLVIAGLMLYALIVEDLYTWMNGGESVIGAWIDRHKVLGTVLKVLIFPLLALAYAIKQIVALVKGEENIFTNFFAVMQKDFPKIYEYAKKYGKYLVMAFCPLSVFYFYWDEIKGFFVRSVSGLVDIVSRYGKNVIMAILPFTALYFYWDEIVAWIKTLPDKIVAFFADVRDKIKAMLKDLAPDWMQRGMTVIANKLGGGEHIAGARAGGGDVDAGKLYRVNENGEEYFRPRMSGTIIPVGAGGGSSRSMVFAPVINISVSGGDPQTIAQAVQDALYNLFNDACSSLGVEA